jgi:hypothetical protein
MRAVRLVGKALLVSASAPALLLLLAGCLGDDHHAAPAPPAASHAPAAPAEARTWSFETDAIGAAPAGFSFSHLGSGPAGAWVVRPSSGAPDGRQVLVQTDTDDTDERYLAAAADAPVLADLRLSVHGRPMAGVVDQVVGLVFRYQDGENYYLARANVLEDNVRLYHVTRGMRQQIGTWKGTVAPGRWHTLAVEARGDHFTVRFDEAVVIDMHDGTIAGAGRIGLWTKADSLTEYDLLHVEPVAR